MNRRVRAAARVAAPPPTLERGLVTVELAIGFLTASLLAITLAGLVILGVTQAAAQRTAAEVARQLARGDQPAADRARAEAPRGGTVTVTQVEQGVEVRVRAPLRILGVGRVEVSAKAWARYEPGAGP